MNPPDWKLVNPAFVHRRVGTAEAYSGHCFAALMKKKRENGVRVEKIVELQVKVAQWKKHLCIISQLFFLTYKNKRLTLSSEQKNSNFAVCWEWYISISSTGSPLYYTYFYAYDFTTYFLYFWSLAKWRFENGFCCAI